VRLCNLIHTDLHLLFLLGGIVKNIGGRGSGMYTICVSTTVVLLLPLVVAVLPLPLLLAVIVVGVVDVILPLLPLVVIVIVIIVATRWMRP
jgi:hypothetical protein